MGASLRSVDQVLGLAGCDLLTVAPNLLASLANEQRKVTTQLTLDHAYSHTEKAHQVIQKDDFKSELEHDLMAFQLLQGGIDGFIRARDQLSTLLRQSFGIDATIHR